MRTAVAFVAAIAVVVASAGCSDDEPLTDEPTPSSETTTMTTDAGDTTPSSSVAEPATTVETTTTTTTEEARATAETTTTTVTEESTTTTTVAAEPWTRPPLDGEWVEVAAGEPWGPALVGQIEALPGGGYVAVTLTSPFVDIAEQDGFSIPTVMWSPDGVEWFDGDPERSIRRPERLAPPPLAVASDHVAVIDGTDFSDHIPLAIGDPRTASWDVIALDVIALDGVEKVSLAASDDEVLVATSSAHERPAGMMDVVTWVIDPTTGTSETGSFTVANQDDTEAPLVAWVDGRWILFASEEPPGPEGGERRDTLWTSSDGLAWSQIDLPIQGVTSLAAGPMGAVAATSAWLGPDADTGVWYSVDGLKWAKVPLSHVTHGGTLTAVGDYGFVIEPHDDDGPALRLVAADGSEVYQMPLPGDAGADRIPTAQGAAASSGDTLLVSAGAIFRGFWLYSPS